MVSVISEDGSSIRDWKTEAVQKKVVDLAMTENLFLSKELQKSSTLFAHSNVPA